MSVSRKTGHEEINTGGFLVLSRLIKSSNKVLVVCPSSNHTDITSREHLIQWKERKCRFIKIIFLYYVGEGLLEVVCNKKLITTLLFLLYGVRQKSGDAFVRF